MDEKNQAPAPEAANTPKKRTQPEIKAQPAQARPVGNMAMPRNRHDVSFRHDVFKSDVKTCITNTAYEKYVLHRVDVEHAHVYHSHNSSGKKNTRTNSACGHWHQVEHYVDPETGATIAKCGPAMREVDKLSPTGKTYRVIEQAYFEEEIVSGEGAGSVRKVVDNHTHNLEYLGSEDLSPLGIQNALKEQRALAATMGISIDPQAVKDNTPAPMNPADGASIV